MRSNPRVADPLTHYIIVRKDLPLGILAAQICHAAGESSPGNLPEGTYAVILEADDQDHLMKLESALAASQARYRAIRENDPPYCGELTAIGIFPDKKSRLKKLLRNLRLLGQGLGGAVPCGSDNKLGRTSEVPG